LFKKIKLILTNVRKDLTMEYCLVILCLTNVRDGAKLMLSLPNISKSEWLIMKIVWAKKQATANDVIDSLADTVSWKPKTVMTLLKRLVDKGVLGYDKSGRAYLYHPIIEEDDCIKSENRSFLKRVYNGSLKPMLVHLVQDFNLTDKEIEELKNLLDEKSKIKID
jgi:BlaI family penicillinase repressor